ncbi:SDR family oxidoreductase [Virgisporangium aurantiacum]|uniref:3-oxoacyl-ACP reductase n=1 Tax=Virgisporangium aurantiacum TaxID=175570 RepID=A0A8J4E0L7_9ACTN|nr:SDR family oxidoreductase [Virgisporangium aurantiacum]GIJ57850.1 3-oxoacyl-ACP reductase [Virgisporangium aurantiacum]
MSTALQDKVALVTGGSRGIGAAIALRLAADGADVAFTYQSNHDRAAGVVEKIKDSGRRAVAIVADSADPVAVRAAVEQAVGALGRLDVLVNNAGVGILKPFTDAGVDEFDRTMAVNVRAAFVAAQAAVPHMSAGGRIVNIGSNVADRTVFPGFSMYATSKAALVGLTKALGRELGPRAITVNLVQPGATDTDLNPADGPDAPAQVALTALGRYASPAEVAAMVAYLAGPEAAYVTGAALTVDGGFNV